MRQCHAGGAARQSLSVHRERHQQGQDVSSRKLILRAFAADEFKSARSLASSVRLKAQAKLIDDPAGEGKPAPPAGDGSRDQQEAGRVSHAEKFGSQ